MRAENNITGIILAGGKSSRMGRDKGFVKLNGVTFMSHIIEALKPLVKEIIVVSNASEYDVFKLKRVEDIIENSGPLAGLYSGLVHSETEDNMVLSCDVPLINTVVLKKLIDGFTSETDVIQIESRGRTMPLIAMYKKRCAPHFLKHLEQGERRLRVALQGLQLKTITLAPDLELYVRNINKLGELNDLRHELEH
jgi:molybdopterin-guanine dinucleotide biosynthesis protein A